MLYGFGIQSGNCKVYVGNYLEVVFISSECENEITVRPSTKRMHSFRLAL